MTYFTPPVRLSFEPPRATGLTTPVIFEDLGPQRWEYHTVTIDPREDEPLDEAALNALGKDGWLLAGTLQHPGREPGRLTYYFVRPATS
jgi:hypothetical protein